MHLIYFMSRRRRPVALIPVTLFSTKSKKKSQKLVSGLAEHESVHSLTRVRQALFSIKYIFHY